MTLRYQASEVNRLFFSGWAWVQLPLAGLTLILVRFADCGRALQAVAGVMLAIVVGLALYVVPEDGATRRMIDFAPEMALSDVRSMFWDLAP